MVLVGGIRGHPSPQVCACISWCIWQLWDFGWRMSKRFLGMINIRTMRDKRVCVSATLGLAASLVLTLCGRNRKRRINKGPCEPTTSKQCSFRAYMVKCHGQQREKHSLTHSTSSQQCSERFPAAEVMRAEDSWMDYKRAGTPSDFLLCTQECQAQCLTSNMHSMYISEWVDEFEWSSLTCRLWDMGLI